MANNWTLEQKKAIELDNRNILVSAAAGSGKTAVLVERIIQKIVSEDNPVDIDKMVIVTFTKAAASEMKQRIRESIESYLDKEPENARLQRQLTLINNAQITTIDSFCLNIIRNYFTDIDIDPGFRTADEGEIKLLEHDVMEQLLEDYYAEGSDEFIHFVDGYGTGRDDTAIESIILKLYNFARSYPWQDEWFASALSLYDIDSEEAFENNLAVRYLKDYVFRRLNDYYKKYEVYKAMCDEVDGPKQYKEAITDDSNAISLMLGSNTFNDLAKRVRLMSFTALGRKKVADVSEEKKAYIKDGRDDFKNFLTKTLKGKIFTQDVTGMIQNIKENYEAVSVMIKLAKDFSDRIQAEKRDRNIIDFNDMEHLALNVLVHRENGVSTYTDASDILSEYYSEILIDEYQDSNMLQEEILTAVSRGKVNPEYNNIYMVGDVKQSIYRFRMARPQLFMEKYNTYTNDESKCQKIELQKNFRSRKNVLECTNDVFKMAMNVDYTGVLYDDSAKLNVGFDYDNNDNTLDNNLCVTFGADNATEILLVSPKEPEDEEITQEDNNIKDVNKAVDLSCSVSQSKNKKVNNILLDEELTSKEQQARAIANRIKQLVEGDTKRPYMVYDKKCAEGYRRIKYSDIVILLRTITGWADVFVNELMNNGIPAYSDATTGYFNVREIKLIINYLTIIDNPLQDIPMAAVMLSYFGKFDTDELSKIRLIDRKRCLYTIMSDIAEYVKLVNDDNKTSLLLKDNLAKSDNISNLDNNCITTSLKDDNSIEKQEDIKDGDYLEKDVAKAVQQDLGQEAVSFETLSYIEMYGLMNLDEKLIEKIISFVEALEVFRQKSELMSIYSLLWEVMYNTGYYDYVGTMPAGKARQANLDLLLSIASSFESTSYNGLFNFLRYVQRMQKFEVDFGEASILGENENLVRVMSIHKSKGLEFPVVFVAGMDKKLNLMDATGNVVVDQDFGVGTNVVNLNKRIKNPTCIKAAVGIKITQESISEELRVLYVAMTRAREKLIMVGTVSSKSKENKIKKWQDKARQITKLNGFSYSDVSEVQNYFDVVMPVAYMDNNSGIFKILELDTLNKSDIEQEDIQANILKNSDIAVDKTVIDSNMSQQEILNKSDIQHNKDTINSESKVENSAEDLLNKSDITQEELPPYPYKTEASSKLKVTVSELKKMQTESDIDEQSMMIDELKEALEKNDEEDNEIIPDFISGEKKVLVGNERGSAYHKVMACLDYSIATSKEAIADNIKQMYESEKLSKAQYDTINVNDIYTFICSDIGKLARQAYLNRQLKREQPFVFIDKEAGNDLIIQGVIDMCIQEADGITIVDYKTDKVYRSKSGEEELKKRYKVQLDYYAKAVSQITGLNIKRKLIYSFTLGKTIQL